MRVLLRRPTEEACKAFEAILAETFYYSDDCEGSQDVSYTVSDAEAVRVRQWRERAKVSCVVDDAVILEDGTEETSQPVNTKNQIS